MKWRNVDIGAGCYYITGTCTEWLPLLGIPDVRQRVCSDIEEALRVCGGSLVAFVIMPTHVHLLVSLPGEGLLHRFNKTWRGRSGRHIPRILAKLGYSAELSRLSAHATGGCQHAAWKEQVRALAIFEEPKLVEKVNYIHANPVRGGLVADAMDWPFSSLRFYERGESVCLPVSAFEA